MYVYVCICVCERVECETQADHLDRRRTWTNITDLEYLRTSKLGTTVCS